MLKRLILSLTLFAGLALGAAPAHAAGAVSDTFSVNEIVDTGGQFFGSVSQGLASLVEKAASQFGLPNGYILGEEGSGAIFVGGRYAVFALVAGIELALAIAAANENGARAFLTQDVPIGQAELAGGLLDERG